MGVEDAFGGVAEELPVGLFCGGDFVGHAGGDYHVVCPFAGGFGGVEEVVAGAFQSWCSIFIALYADV